MEGNGFFCLFVSVLVKWTHIVLIPSVCYIEYYRLVFYQQQIYFSQFCSPRYPRSRHWKIWCLVRTTSWFTNDCLLPVYSQGRRYNKSSLGSFKRAHIPFLSTASSNYYFPKASNTITLCIRF